MCCRTFHLDLKEGASTYHCFLFPWSMPTACPGCTCQSAGWVPVGVPLRDVGGSPERTARGALQRLKQGCYQIASTQNWWRSTRSKLQQQWLKWDLCLIGFEVVHQQDLWGRQMLPYFACWEVRLSQFHGAGRRHETAGSETENFVTYCTAGSMRHMLVFSPKSHRDNKEVDPSGCGTHRVKRRWGTPSPRILSFLYDSHKQTCSNSSLVKDMIFISLVSK